jgi:hypothetical protein
MWLDRLWTVAAVLFGLLLFGRVLGWLNILPPD